MKKSIKIVVAKLKRFAFQLYPFTSFCGRQVIKPVFHKVRKQDTSITDSGVKFTLDECSGRISNQEVASTRKLTEAVLNESSLIWDSAGMFEIERGSVYGADGVCVSESGAILHHSVRCYGRPRERHRLFYSLYPVKPKYEFGVVLVAQGVSSENFYHFICDQIPRILYALEKGYEFDKVLVRNASSFQKELLSKLGLQDKVITLEDGEYLQAEKILCPTYPYDGRISPNMTKRLATLGSLFESAQVSTYDKIFINRRSGRTLSDKSAERSIKERGFHEIFLEDYSLPEQITLLRSAREIVAIHGAGLTNLVFVDDQAKLQVYELFNAYFINLCYCKVSLVKGLNYHAVVDTSASKLEKKKSTYNGADINVSESDLDAALVRSETLN